MEKRATAVKTTPAKRGKDTDAKLSEEDIREIRSLYFSGKMTGAELGIRYGLTPGHTHRILNGFKPSLRREAR